MLKSLIKALGVVAGLVLSGLACAVSLGGINVTTALGEPLKAEIALETASIAETNSLTARMASPDAFKNAGVDYPYGLPLLTFQIETNPVNGEAYLKVTSAQPVNEPFVNLLVELSWSSGRLLREYTFLLDPPGYVAEQPAVAEVQPVEPAVDMPSSAFQPQADEVKDESGLVTQEERPSAAPVAQEKEPAESTPVADTKPARGSYIASGSIKVKRGDTLHKLATQVKSPDISLERMLVALYRANADAFDGNNMNRLKTGKILQVPELSEFDSLEQEEAVQEIRAQAADWHAYRQKLAAASKQAAEGSPKQEASGKISTKVADQTPAAKESAKEVVRLSKGEAPDDKAVAGGSAKSAKEKGLEEAIARNKAIQESNERVAMLEKNIKAMQRLAELKSQAAADQAKSGAKQAEGAAAAQSGKLEALPKMQPPPADAASEIAATSAVPSAAPVPKVKVVTAQPSILDDILEQPLYLAGLAAALLGLLGFGFMRSRRGKGAAANNNVSTDEEVVKDADHTGGGKFALFGSVLGLFRRKRDKDATENNKVIAGDKVAKDGDHTGGGKFALFGSVLGLFRRKRDKGSIDETIEDVGSTSGRITAPVIPSPETGDFTKTLVSRTAISHAPTDEVDPISEAELFLNFGRDEQAEEILKDALGKDPANHQIHLKLLSIYANRKDANAFSGIAGQLKDSGDASVWEQVVAMGLKLEPNNPLYGGDGAAATAEKAAAPSVGSDTMIDVGTVKKQDIVMDFDLGAGTAKMPAASAEPAEIAEPGQDQTVVLNAPMDFDITGSHTNMTAPAAENAEAAEVKLDDLVFDVTGSHDAGQPGSKEDKPAAAPEEAGESISYLLDFPGVTKPEAAPPQAASSAALDIGLAGINLNLDEPVAPAPVAPAPSSALPAEEMHGDDVATKLDLAKAYQEMGDSNGAREILEEVVRDGNEEQRAAAKALLQALPA